jgi:hypothetical protein
LNCTYCFHHNPSCNNCPHTNSIDNWSIWVLSETTRVWNDSGKFPKSVNINPH